MSIDPRLPVLVVEDSPVIVKIVQGYLRTLGFFDIDAASDGIAALGKMKGKRYELIISDWDMTPMSGFELLTATRRDSRYANVPFIMATAKARIEAMAAARDAGAAAYIAKPFDADGLKATIEAAMRAAF